MVAFIAIFAVLMAFGVWLGARLAERLSGQRWRDRPPAQRRMVWGLLAVSGAIALVCAWAFTMGRPAVGIGVLVGFYVVPELVLLPVRIHRSRRRADEARARRTNRAAAGRSRRDVS